MARKSRKHIETEPTPAKKEAAHSAGAYIRLSAVDKKQKGDSIETQRAIIEMFIAAQPDIELRDVYIDDGLSGQSFERPSFRRMVCDMENGKIDCCVTKDLSRLGRNAIDTGFYIEKYFPMNGIRFIAITDDYDSADGSCGGIMVSLKNMVNEAYALEIGRKIRATKQMNIRSGYFVGRLPPYGYMKSREDSYRLAPDECTALIVKRMFEMAASGESVTAIVKWLNSNGILPPRRYLHSIGVATEKEANGHIHWNKGIVYEILKNRVYCGDMVQGKHRTQSYEQKKLPQSEWVVTENTHEGIVSRDLFAEVQALWGKSGEPPKKRYEDPSTKNIFLRKVFCGHCGFTMPRRRNSKTHYSFRCNTQHMYDKSDCTLVRINENALKEKLIAALHAQDSGFAIRLAEAGSAAQAEKEKAELRDAQTELDKNSRYLKGLYESLSNGAINDAEYRQLKTTYETKIAALAAFIKELRNAAHDRIRRETEIAKASGSIQSVHGISDLTAEAVDSLIEKVRVFEDKSIRVKFTFADEEFMYGEEADDE
ncbi:MAG: recombinase family protein [Defluviitaleaceae bacterium]|nr:recombinase family protein [Defluviitaleaceae bacterium]